MTCGCSNMQHKSVLWCRAVSEEIAVVSSMSSMRLLMQPQGSTDLLTLDPLHAGGSPLAGVGAGHSGTAPLTLAGGLGIFEPFLQTVLPVCMQDNVIAHDISDGISICSAALHCFMFVLQFKARLSYWPISVDPCCASRGGGSHSEGPSWQQSRKCAFFNTPKVSHLVMRPCAVGV